ncbi:MAG: hypothetical protein JWO76_2927 [Nocardioides sp.]|nr:hypothetical protein [Nocardioides sp.]
MTSRARRARTSWLGARSILSALGGGGLLLVVVPLVAGAPWSAVGRALGAVPAVDLAALTVIWLAGLLVHTVTLRAALPGLTHRRALTLSLTGSAVSNVLPFGGAAGIALNYRMVRAWGFERPAFVAYTVVTNVWDVLVKLGLPVVSLGWLLLVGGLAPAPLVAPVVAATVALALVCVAGAAVFFQDRVAIAVGSLADRACAGVLRLLGSRREPRLAAATVRTTASCRSVVVASWRRLTVGMVGYSLLLLALLWGCLHATGGALPPAVVFAAFALERVLTLVGVTPGGAGVVEVGLVGLLVAAGGDPAGAVAGTLLYRTFTYGLEIPVGGATLAVWLVRRRSGIATSPAPAALERVPAR